MRPFNKHNNKKADLKIWIMFILFILPTFMYSTENKDATEEKINVELKTGEYEHILIKSGFHVTLTQNEKIPAYISAEPLKEQLKYLKFSVQDNVLEIYSTKKIKDNETVHLVISFQTLKSIKTQGEVTIETQENIHLSQIDLNLSQETFATLYISSLDFLCNAEGKGNLTIEGDITNYRLNASGNLVIDNKIRTHTLYTYAKDETEVNFYGKADYTQFKVIGESFLQAFELEVKDCLITVSDYGDACVSVKDHLDITGTKNGSIHYRGAPEVKNQYTAETVFIKKSKEKKIKTDYYGAK